MWSFSDKILCIDVTPKFRARNGYNEYGDGNNLDNASNFKIVLVYNLKYCYERDNNKKRTVKKVLISNEQDSPDIILTDTCQILYKLKK